MRRWRRWRELEDELRSHARMAAEDGRAPASLDAAQEATRDQWAWTWLDDFGRDLRYGARGLRRSPGFALVAVLTLALGIGASSVMFSLVNGVLLRPLPYPQPARLVATTQYYPKGALAFLRAQSHALELAGYMNDQGFNLTSAGAPAEITGSAVSANLFSVLGVSAALGRTFAPGEDLPGADHEVLLSQALWRQRFHADPSVVGRTITVAGVDRQIVGVMPTLRLPSAQTELWVPLRLDPRDRGEYWYGSYMQLAARLRPGETLGTARAEWQALRPRLLAAYGKPMPPKTFSGATLVSLQALMVGDSGPTLWLLLGAVGLLLLIACVNVANLLLARSAARRQEWALRAALGAGRGRLQRQLVAEGMLLAFLGGALGLALAAFGLSALKALLPTDLPRLAEVSLDPRVLGFALLLATATGVGFGLAAEGGRPARRRARVSGALVIAEVALSAMLVVAAGLAVRSLWNLAAINPGFRAQRVEAARITPNPTLCAAPGRCWAFYDQLLGQTRALPGVAAAAVVNALPLSGVGELFTYRVEAHPLPVGAQHPLAVDNIVSPGYLATMGIPLLRGRDFSSADAAAGAPGVVLVSQDTAAKLWPGQEAVGERLQADGYPGWRTVVGVVGNVREASVTQDTFSFESGVIYSPYGASAIRADNSTLPPPAMTLLVRVSAGLLPSLAALPAQAAGIEPSAAVSQVESLESWVANALAAPRSTAWLFALFAGLALLLGAIGMYGVLAYAVARRVREIGIRMALGARKSEVLRLVVGHAAKLALAGVGLGLGGALLLTRLMSSLLYGVSPQDPLTYAAVALLWPLVALVASAIPARRAARVDPVVALRCE